MSVDTRDTDCCLTVSPTRLSLSSVGFPTPFDYGLTYVMSVRTPKVLLLSVWPLPLSLAATYRISFDFSSSAYLDVSLRRVPLIILFVSYNDP